MSVSPPSVDPHVASVARGETASLARGGTLNVFGSAAGALLATALIAIVTRAFGADLAGAYFEVVALYSIAVVCLCLGADTGLVRFVSQALATEGAVGLRWLLPIALVPVISGAVVASVAGWFAAAALGRSLGGGDETAAIEVMLKAVVVFLPLGACSLTILAATRGFGTMLPTVTSDRIGRPAVQLVAVSWVILAGTSIVGLAVGWGAGVVATWCLATVWLWHLARRAQAPARQVTGSWTELAIRFWAFSLPRALASAFRVGVLWLDVVLVGALISPSAAAIYTVATRLVQAGFLAVDAIGQSIEPLFSSLLARERLGRANALYQVATGWLVGITWPLFLTVWLFAPALLRIFGQEFTEGDSIVAILALSALVGSGLGPIDVLLVMSGRTMWSLWNSIAALTINVVLNVVLIPRLGLDGAAIAWAISRLTANVLPLIEIRTVYPFHPFGRGWRVASIASLVTFGVVGVVGRSLGGANLTTLIACLAISSVLYCATAWRYRVSLDLSEFSQILRGGFRQRGKQVG